MKRATTRRDLEVTELEHRNMETGVGFPAHVGMGGGRICELDYQSILSAGVCFFAFVSLLLLLSVERLHACEFDPFPDNYVAIDRRIIVADDGSFQNAAPDDDRYAIDGKPIVDAGGGRIGQRIIYEGPCEHNERLLVVDCSTKEEILVNGIQAISEGGFMVDYPYSSIDNILYPKGPIRLSRMGVEQIETVAKKSGLEFVTDVTGEIARMKRRNRYDPYFGCKIFYPGSPGAG
jgi:hypothetical protein